jgi:hypothetical protein
MVLSFHDSILLRNTRVRKLLINTILKTKLIDRGILELGHIIAVNNFKQLRCSFLNLKPKL